MRIPFPSDCGLSRLVVARRAYITPRVIEQRSRTLLRAVARVMLRPTTHACMLGAGLPNVLSILDERER